MSYLAFLPIYQKRVWGGRNIEHFLGRTLPEDVPIGESWDVVDRPEAQSVVTSGPFKGQTLRDVIKHHAEDIMGPHWPENKPFPILIKWLDCADRLSLQVHPPASLAADLGGEPKSENWYIADTQNGASLIAGLKSGITRDVFENALTESTLEDCVHRFPVKPGDSLFVHSGRIHAIDAGNMILEIQENSDTTYRVYDWGRTGLDGQPRELHVEKSLKSIDFNDFEPKAIHHQPGDQELATCSSFRIRKFDMTPNGKPLQFGVGEQPTLLSIVKGSLRLTGAEESIAQVPVGANILLPYNAHFSFEASEPSTILVTDNFTQ